MDKAKALQAEHWTAVFREGVDERFYNRAVRIGNVHARIGLKPKWYVGPYGLILEELTKTLGNKPLASSLGGEVHLLAANPSRQ